MTIYFISRSAHNSKTKNVMHEQYKLCISVAKGALAHMKRDLAASLSSISKRRLESAKTDKHSEQKHWC